MNVLGIPGSLRRASFNRGLLIAASELAPEGLSITLADLGEIPLYNGDFDEDDTRPPAVEAFKRSIAEADALIIATPEYNYGIPGMLKNAIDWASRPAYRSVFAGKPVGIVSASPSGLGGVRAQAHLKQVLLGMVSEVFAFPEFAVASAHQKFEDGRLVDADSRNKLQQMLVHFERWALARGAT